MTDTSGAFPSRSFELVGEHSGRRYEVTVELPNRYHRSDKAYPMVVVLDGQWVFGVVRDAFRIMSLDRELPEAVVVGVAHANPGVRDLLQDRAADFTPTEADSPKETGIRIPAEAVGRAHLFRRTLLDEIMPAVAGDYRLNGDRTLVGHSFSALFALDTFLSEGAGFDRWVMASPSVWWDDRVMFSRETEHAARTHDLGGRVFMSAGSEEGGPEGYGGHREFHDQLAGRNYPSLDLSWTLFQGETHSSVISAAVSRGLRTVFA